MHFIFSVIRFFTESKPPIPIDINLKGMAIASIKIIWLALKYSSPNIEKIDICAATITVAAMHSPLRSIVPQLKRKTAKSLDALF